MRCDAMKRKVGAGRLTAQSLKCTMSKFEGNLKTGAFECSMPLLKTTYEIQWSIDKHVPMNIAI